MSLPLHKTPIDNRGTTGAILFDEMRLFLVVYLGLFVALAGFASAAGYQVYRDTGPSNSIEAVADRHAWDVASWEVRYFPQKWLYKIGQWIKGRPGGSDEDSLQRYFALNDQIATLEAQGPSAPLDAATRERDQLGSRVEDILQGRITQLLKDEGLAMRPPIFSDLGIVFPPVDFRIVAPPRVLATSPRGRIELDSSYLLDAGLSLDTVTAIEKEAESAKPSGYPGGVSALVIRTGGLATYPAVVADNESYEGVVTTAIHEWVHGYLAFFPLGSSYFAGSETRTLNESVADLSSQALAQEYVKRWPHLTPTPSSAPASATPSPTQPVFDFRKEMHDLRLQVDAMLKTGKIVQAEALMEAKRQEFAQHGYVIRRLNQAYFAFNGTYADTPASVDPIGPKLQALLERSKTPGAFLELVAGITDVRGLDALLAASRG